MSGSGGGAHLQNGINILEDPQIEAVIAEIRRLAETSSSSVESRDHRTRVARAAIVTLEKTGFMQSHDCREHHHLVISSLQRFAYRDADSGGIPDIGDWCTDQWLLMLQRNAEDRAALRGQSNPHKYLHFS